MPVIDTPVEELDQPSIESSGRDMLKGRAIYRAALAYGRFIHRFRWPVLVLWVIIFGVSVGFMLQIINLLGGGDTSVGGSESVQVATLLKQQFHQTSSQVLVAFQSSSTAVSNPTYQQEISSLAGTLRALPQVASVTLNPQAGADGKTTLLIVESRANVDLPIDTLRHLLTATSGPARTYLTGGPAIDDDIVNATRKSIPCARTFPASSRASKYW